MYILIYYFLYFSIICYNSEIDPALCTARDLQALKAVLLGSTELPHPQPNMVQEYFSKAVLDGELKDIRQVFPALIQPNVCYIATIKTFRHFRGTTYVLENPALVLSRCIHASGDYRFPVRDKLAFKILEHPEYSETYITKLTNTKQFYDYLLKLLV